MVEVEPLTICTDTNPEGTLNYQLVLPPGVEFASESEAERVAGEMNRVLEQERVNAD